MQLEVRVEERGRLVFGAREQVAVPVERLGDRCVAARKGVMPLT
jgi:hypothetical protein